MNDSNAPTREQTNTRIRVSIYLLMAHPEGSVQMQMRIIQNRIILFNVSSVMFSEVTSIAHSKTRKELDASVELEGQIGDQVH